MTGTINNQGVINDIEFVGKILTGGSLDGQISVQKGGVLEDVTLLSNTHLDGGTLIDTRINL